MIYCRQKAFSEVERERDTLGPNRVNEEASCLKIPSAR